MLTQWPTFSCASLKTYRRTVNELSGFIVALKRPLADWIVPIFKRNARGGEGPISTLA